MGTVPPEIGGVTMFTKRLIDSFEDDSVVLVLYDYKRRPIYCVLFSILSTDLIHINVSNKWLRTFLVVCSRILLKKTIIMFHGFYDFSSLLDKLCLYISNFSITLNDETYLNALKIVQKSQVCKMSPFLPPANSEKILSNDSIINHLSIMRGNYDYIYGTNATSYALDDYGQEIYMGSKIIDFFKAKNHIGLVFSDPSGEYRDYFLSSGKQIPSNVFIISYPHSFVGILANVDGLIRATISDGDSVSIHEALSLGKVLHATDVVSRPKGVLTFQKPEEIDLEYLPESSEYCAPETVKNLKRIYSSLYYD